MFWARLGSLNALKTVAGVRFWNQWLGQPLCSVDTIGRVQAQSKATSCGPASTTSLSA